jgi:hypothetical protein
MILSALLQSRHLHRAVSDSERSTEYIHLSHLRNGMMILRGKSMKPSSFDKPVELVLTSKARYRAGLRLSGKYNCLFALQSR